MRPSLKLSVFILLATLTTANTNPPGFCDGGTVITKISNDPFMIDHHLYGGFMGGTRLYIQGTGFDASDSHTNQVYVGSIHCPVDKYFTTPERIVCEIEPAHHKPQNDLTIVVKSCGKIAKCENNDCTLNIDYNRTPMMHNVVPQANFAGDDIGITGIWRANKYSDLKEVRISQRNCLISEDKIESSNLSWWGTAKINCQIPDDMESGYHKLTVTSQKGTGFSQDLSSAHGFKVGHESTVYNVRVHPKINELSSHKGFLNGQKLTIKGRGFGTDLSKLNVKVADKNCKVLKAYALEKEVEVTQPTEAKITDGQAEDKEQPEPEKNIIIEEFIECEIEKLEDLPEKKIFIGGAGLAHLRWEKIWTNWADIMDGEMKVGEDVLPPTKSVMLSAENYFQSNNYTQYARGIFRTGEKGTYKFALAADDHAALYLSTQPFDPSKDIDFENGFSKKCYIDGWTYFREFHNVHNEFQECQYELEANTDYFMLLFQTEGGGGDHLSLKVTTPNTKTGLPNTNPNVQEIKVDYTPVRKEYTIKVMGLVSGKFTLKWSQYNSDKQKYDYLRSTRDIPITYTTDQISYEIRRGNGVYNEVTKQNLNKSGNPATASDDVYGFLITVKQNSYWTRNLTPILATKDLVHIDDPNTDTVEKNGSIVLAETVPQSPQVDGTFRLKYGDFETSDIKYYYNSAHIVERLQIAFALSNGISGYTIGSRYDGHTWRIAFDSVVGDPLPLQVISKLCTDCSNVTNPGNITMTVNHNYIKASNELVYLPVPSDMLFSYSNKPQVVVDVAGNLAGCIDGTCDYEFYPKDNSPIIESFDYTTTPGKLIIQIQNGYQAMKGLGDNTMDKLMIQDNMAVRFGNIDCPISNISLSASDTPPTKITCDIPIHKDNSPKVEAGDYKPMVHLKEHGYFLHKDGIQPYQRSLDIDSISPAVGSTGGGTLITIEGKGFALKSDYQNSNTVTIGGQPCVIQTFTPSQIKCVTPELTGASEAVITSISVNTLTKTTNLFKYSDAITPKITSLTPHDSSPVLKNDLVINGTGFDSDKSKFTVWLKPALTTGKEYLCNVVSSTTTQITCRLSGGKAGEYQIKVHQTGVGFSKPATTGANKFEYKITVTSISPSSGSTQGGTILTITGTNFSTVLKENQVVIGETGFDYCIIQNATPTQLKCKVNKPMEELAGEQVVYVLGRAKEEAVCDKKGEGTVCGYTFDPAKTHEIVDITPRDAVKDSTVTIQFTKDLAIDADIEVFIGGKKATGLKINETDKKKVSFNFPELQESSHVPIIHIIGEGYAKLPKISQTIDSVVHQKFIEMISTLKYTKISPTTGGWSGNILEIHGNGFTTKDAMRIKVYNRVCTILEFSHSLIKCEFFNLSKSREYGVTVEILKNNSYHKIECEDCKYKTIAAQPTMKSFIANPDITNLDNFSVNFSGDNLYSVDGIGTFNQNDMVVELVPQNTKYSEFKIIGTKATGPGSINAKFPNVMAGSYNFRHFVKETGYSINNGNAISFEPIKPLVDNITKVNSSLLGGTVLTVTGKGFPEDKHKNLAEVLVANQPCQIISSKWDEIKCKTPLILTKGVQETLKIFKPQVQKGGNQITGSGSADNYLIDGKIDTYSSGNDMQIDFGEGNKVHVTKVRMFPRVRGHEPYLVNTIIEGTNGGENAVWTKLFEIKDVPAENWNTYTPPQNETWEYRFYRFSNPHRHVQIAEAEFTGYKYADITTFDFENGQDLDVTVKVMGVAFTGTETHPITNTKAKVHYKKDLTGKVTSLSPKMGTTIGGTELTINGEGFDKSDTKVTIDGIDCPIDQAKSAATKLVCTTGKRPTFTPSTLEIISESRGKVNTDGHLFLYIDRWSSTNTWGGESAPREGDSVHVPKGQVLLVDVSPPPLYAVIVEGMLVFEDAKDLTFEAWFIMVRYGRLEIGMPDKPFTHKLTITMHGNRYSKMLGGFGNKGIFVQDGTIDIHGVPRNKTWTTLEKSAGPEIDGGNKITLHEDVDWKAGEEIVIAPTGLNLKEDELNFIKSISGRVITLEKPLKFKHFAGDVNLTKKPDGSFVTETLRAEVGLLTRNVKIQGDPSTVDTKHGVHILLRGSTDNCRGRYSYIEVFRAGQEFQLGRYPIHYHMIGSVHDNYVRGNAIHETFNRGTTIHGVHYLTLEKNVYHRTKGHTIFLEDGIETNNIIQDNMVVNVRKATSMLMSDMKPSGIWMARPNNYVRRNRLIGCEGNGTWFELVAHPTGPSATGDICSVKDHLMEYKSNVHHSNVIGLRIYPHYFPKTNPCDPLMNDKLRDHFEENPGLAAKYEDNIMYSNGLGSFGKKLGRIEYINMKLISNGSNQKVSEPNNAYDQRPRNIGGYSVGKSAVGDFHGHTTESAINFGNKSGFLVKDTIFYNFPSTSKMFKFCGGCRSEVKRTEGGKRQTFLNITFQDVEAKVLNFSLPEYDLDIVRDKDGSLLKHLVSSDEDKLKFKDGGWVTFDNAHLRNIKECKAFPAGQAFSHDSVICDNTINLVTAKMTVLDNYHLLAGQDLKIFNHQDGTFNKNHVLGESNEFDKQRKVFGFSKFRNCQLSIGWRGWAAVVATGYKYNLHFGEGVEWKKLRLKNDYYWGPLKTDEASTPVTKESQQTFTKSDAELETEYNKFRFKPVYFSWNHTEPRELYDGWYTGLDSGKTGKEDGSWISTKPVSSPVTFDKDSDGNIKKDVDGNQIKLSKPLNDDRFNFADSWGSYHHDSIDKILVWKLDALKRGTLESEAIYCRDHCPTEENNNENVVYVDKSWNVAADWLIPEAEGVTAQAAQVPAANQTVIIDTTWNMIFNETAPTPILEKLIIKGKLTFKSDIDNLVLNAKIIVIENGGELLIGEPNKPHTLNASINLHGNKDSTYQVVADNIPPVNKAIINKGKMKIYGVIPDTTWTVLSKKIKKGESHFYIRETTQNTKWKANDELVIASSTTQEAEREKVTIDSLVNNSQEIKIKEAFKHFHYGAPTAHATTQGTIEMRAEVGNLSRNIKIQSIAGDSWGCTILTPFIPAINKGKINSPGAKGYIIMHGVEVKNCGQRDTAKAALDLKYAKWENSITQSIKGCTFNNSQGWAVNIDGIQNLDFVNNIIYDARKTGVFIQKSLNVKFEYNLIVGIKIRENYNNIEYWDVLNAIHYNDTTSLKTNNVSIKHNSVSSSPWFGYAVPGYECPTEEEESNSKPHEKMFFNNTAHSCKGGWFPTKIDNQNCNIFANFNGYKNDEQGFQQRVDIFEVRAKNMILADNRNAFSMNGAPGKSQNYPKAHFSDSYIIGKALESACPECYQAATECETSGFYSALFNNAPYEFYFEKTRMPLHNSTSHSFKYGGKQNLTNVVFENFNHVENCSGKSYALRMNNFYQDNTNTIYVDKLTLKNVGDKSKFFFPNHKRHLRTPVYCGKRDCTGNYNTPFFDSDGSILGRPMHYFGNNLGAGRDGDCTFFEDWNGHACNPVYAQLLIRAPSDERGLVYFPLKLSIEDYDKDVSSDLKFYHESDSGTELTSLVKIEKMTFLTYSQTMPSNVRYELATAKKTDWAIFKVYSENPATMSVYVNNGKTMRKPGVLHVGEKLDLSKKKTQCGANFYDNKNRFLYFVLTGQTNCNVTVKLKNALQLSTRLNIPPAEFFSSNMVTTFLDRMAALLEIDIDRIRIVDVREGSTIVVTDIESSKEIEEERNNKESVTKELESFQEKFESAVAEGTVDFGAEVLDVSADLAIDNVPPTTTPTTGNTGSGTGTTTGTTKPTEEPTNNNPVTKEKSKTGMYIGIGAGVAVVVIAAVCLILYFCVCKKKAGTSKKSYHSQNVTKEQQSIQNINRNAYNVNKSPVLGKLGNITRKTPIPVQQGNQDLQDYVGRTQFANKP